MKRFLTISPREGSEPRAATSATSGTGPAVILPLPPAPRGSLIMQIMIKRNEREHSRTSGLENSLG